MVLAAAACSAHKNPATARGQARIRSERVAATAPGGFAGCERRLEHSVRPVLAVAGASFTAGTGPGDPRLSWAVRLADALRWNAVIVGVPGTGYARAGADGQGPALRLLARENLAALRPALVILQFGHDDIGVPAAAERRRVAATLSYVRARVPRARIALITVFTAAGAGPHLAAAERTDAAIVSVAAAFSSVVMNPLTQDWTFQRAVRGGLHPSAAGDAQIAEKVAGVLHARGVLPAPAADHGAPLICQSGFAGHHVRTPGRAD
jgi:lysophospholipase L1-like esterase